jgi:hypothetical protein
VVPVSVLSNAYLAESDNARFLLALAGRLPERWQFDEYHHGLSALDGPPETLPRVVDALAVQLILLYVVALAMLGRRFFRAWPPLEARFSNHRDYLEGIGQLHQRLGHSRAAAFRLWRRFALYEPSFPRLQLLEAALGRKLRPGEQEDQWFEELGSNDPDRFLKLARILSASPAPAPATSIETERN